jgi:hypothetical protein
MGRMMMCTPYYLCEFFIKKNINNNKLDKSDDETDNDVHIMHVKKSTLTI